MINEPWAKVMLERLTVLDLKNLNIGDKGAEIFVDGPSNFPNLTSLDLGDNSIGDEGDICLSATPFLENLTSLGLGGNSIEDKEAIALARHPNLTSLSINHNKSINHHNIGLTGAQALAKNKTLTALIMRWNKAEDEGAEAFSTNTTLK
jgi:Leucine-rich repeat (LRR) protein